MGENCCKNTGNCSNGVVENGTENGQTSDYLPLDSTQDPIFPPELRTDQFDVETISFKGEKVEWYRPTTLKQLLELKGKHPQAKLVIGNTEVGLEVKLKNMNYPVIIGCTHIPELNQITQLDNGVKFGSSVTLTDIEDTLKTLIKKLPGNMGSRVTDNIENTLKTLIKKLPGNMGSRVTDNIENTLKTLIKKLPDYQTRVFQAIVEILRWFAGHQIRNVAAVGGNIITASPISDLNPLFLAAGAVLEVESADGSKRNITMNDKFFLGYRKTALKSDEVLLNVTVPFTRKNEYFGGYKQANRREDDIAIVNAGFRVLFEDNTNTIKEMAMAFGGMAPTTVMAVKTMKEVVGRKWDESLIDDVCRLMADDLQLTPGAPGGMVEYRRTLTTSFFFKFYLTTQLQLQQQKSGPSKKVPKSFTSATPNFHRGTSKGSQIYEEVAPGQLPQDAVGRPLTHLSAMKQATGEAIYVDDMPSIEGELYLALVTSTQAHAKLLKVDPTKALSMTGVVDFISHKDVPGHNTWGIIPEESFASTEVLCIGHIIGAVIADTQAHAQAAAKAVDIEYEKLESIITIKEAIAKNSYWTEAKTINCGDIVKGFEQADHVIEGEVHVGGQEHFYLETNATLAVPKNEDGEMEIFVSTQNPTETQMVVAETLGVAANKILVRVKRLGGGFGGKETRSICLSTPVALAAYLSFIIIEVAICLNLQLISKFYHHRLEVAICLTTPVALAAYKLEVAIYTTPVALAAYKLEVAIYLTTPVALAAYSKFYHHRLGSNLSDYTCGSLAAYKLEVAICLTTPVALEQLISKFYHHRLEVAIYLTTPVALAAYKLEVAIYLTTPVALAAYKSKFYHHRLEVAIYLTTPVALAAYKLEVAICLTTPVALAAYREVFYHHRLEVAIYLTTPVALATYKLEVAIYLTTPVALAAYRSKFYHHRLEVAIYLTTPVALAAYKLEVAICLTTPVALAAYISKFYHHRLEVAIYLTTPVALATYKLEVVTYLTTPVALEQLISKFYHHRLEVAIYLTTPVALAAYKLEVAIYLTTPVALQLISKFYHHRLEVAICLTTPVALAAYKLEVAICLTTPVALAAYISKFYHHRLEVAICLTTPVALAAYKLEVAICLTTPVALQLISKFYHHRLEVAIYLTTPVALAAYKLEVAICLTTPVALQLISKFYHHRLEVTIYLTTPVALAAYKLEVAIYLTTPVALAAYSKFYHHRLEVAIYLTTPVALAAYKLEVAIYLTTPVALQLISKFYHHRLEVAIYLTTPVALAAYKLEVAICLTTPVALAAYRLEVAICLTTPVALAAYIVFISRFSNHLISKFYHHRLGSNLPDLWLYILIVAICLTTPVAYIIVALAQLISKFYHHRLEVAIYLTTPVALAAYKLEVKIHHYTCGSAAISKFYHHRLEVAIYLTTIVALAAYKLEVAIYTTPVSFYHHRLEVAICLTTPVALAAYKLKKPVRCMLDRDEDMLITGTRHPFLGQYKVGFTKEGKVVAAEVNLYNNAGCTFDLSGAVLEQALLMFENCYKIENVRLTGYVCKTNTPSNTAFRGFGVPQSMLVTETFMDEISGSLDHTPEQETDQSLAGGSQVSEASVCVIEKLDKLNEFLSLSGISPVKKIQGPLESASTRTIQRYKLKARQCLNSVFENICPGEAPFLEAELYPESLKDNTMKTLLEIYTKADTWMFLTEQLNYDALRKVRIILR
ncbi:XDH [Mytilus edulis]|uniref:XDH n=1 Tax=Mytilus edulis TaxID=6550 RepID=A0A8S3VPG4_MYTED|nr:XDH [Mytilus edulis]